MRAIATYLLGSSISCRWWNSNHRGGRAVGWSTNSEASVSGAAKVERMKEGLAALGMLAGKVKHVDGDVVLVGN